MPNLKICVFICASALFLKSAMSHLCILGCAKDTLCQQIPKLQHRIRNRRYLFGKLYHIYQHNMDHLLAGSFNITKDFQVKSATVVIYRCTFENAACENFQKWNFDTNTLKSIMYMKNQMWTPLYSNITPKFDPPIIKKALYQTKGAALDAKATAVFYPEVMKYFWRSQLILLDTDDKKPASFTFETSFHTFVERDRKRERGSSAMKP